MSGGNPSCGACKFWGQPAEEWDREGMAGTKICKKAIQLWNATDWDKDDDYRRKVKEEYVGQMMFVQDGSDYMADLHTTAEFFCAHFTPISEVPK